MPIKRKIIQVKILKIKNNNNSIVPQKINNN